MEDNMVKLDEILEAVKYKEAAKKKEEKRTCILWILAIIGIVAAVAAGISAFLHEFCSQALLP